MRFLSRIMGSVPAASRARQERRSSGRRRSPIAVETLEGRALMSGIAGVSVAYGALTIHAPVLSHGNTAQVSIDPSNQFVQVTFDNQTEEFNPSVTPIYNVVYIGGELGGDTFADDTSLASREYGYGAGNNFTGGTSLNYVYFLSGGGNTYNTQGAGSCSDVFEYGGSDTIKNSSGGVVQVYSYL
jgi:hypothetical protein